MTQAVLTLTLMLSLKGMMVPEAVYYDTDNGYAYVTNIVGEGWGDDGDGFISLLNPDGTLNALKWRVTTKDAPLSAPKGMCKLDGKLYCADIGVIHEFEVDGPGSRTIPVTGAQKLNDMATDGRLVYATDTAGGCVFAIDPKTSAARKIPAVESLNGVACHGGKIFVVSWDLHEIYELDASGASAPRALGVAEHFKNLDGIEILPGGSMIVSDFWGNAVFWVSSDAKTVKKLVDVETPADIGIDLEGGRLYVPLFYGDEVKVYSLN